MGTSLSTRLGTHVVMGRLLDRNLRTHMPQARKALQQNRQREAPLPNQHRNGHVTFISKGKRQGRLIAKPLPAMFGLMGTMQTTLDAESAIAAIKSNQRKVDGHVTPVSQTNQLASPFPTMFSLVGTMQTTLDADNALAAWKHQNTNVTPIRQANCQPSPQVRRQTKMNAYPLPKIFGEMTAECGKDAVPGAIAASQKHIVGNVTALVTQQAVHLAKTLPTMFGLLVEKMQSTLGAPALAARQ